MTVVNGVGGGQKEDTLEPVFADHWTTIYQGSCLDVLPLLPANSVQACVCSPPYWGLRRYLPDGDPLTAHELGNEAVPDCNGAFTGQPCGACWVCRLVAVFREVKRVLRPDGTLWLNVGDTFASAWACPRRNVIGNGSLANGKRDARPDRTGNGLKEKDMCMLPARLALALQADGWWLRSEIIWHKVNPMPESVTDRPTKAHEQVYLLTKSPHYFYDAEAVREPFTGHGQGTTGHGAHNKDWGQPHAPSGKNTLKQHKGIGRNLRSVWSLSSEAFSGWIETSHLARVVEGVLSYGMTHRVFQDCPLHASWYRQDSNRSIDIPLGRELVGPSLAFLQHQGCLCEFYTKTTRKESHFAPFPSALVRRCLLVSCSAGGVCAGCGAPYRRQVERTDQPAVSHKGSRFDVGKTGVTGNGLVQPGARYETTATGFSPACSCNAGVISPVCLDLFAGAGTTLLTARDLFIRAVGIELNPAYCALAASRLTQGVLALRPGG